MLSLKKSMNPINTKAVCLLVGENSPRERGLAQALSDCAHTVCQPAESCVEAAQRIGASVAVVFWSPLAKQIAYDLCRALPDLQVVVEKNSRETNGRIEKNGFSLIVDVHEDIQHLESQVRRVCLDNPLSAPQNPPRQRHAAKNFVRQLPAIQSVLDDKTRLADQMLLAVCQAASATKGGLFLTGNGGNDFVLISRYHLETRGAKTSIPLHSEIPFHLQRCGSLIHVDDADIPRCLQAMLRTLGCNLLLPLLGESGLDGWIILHVKEAIEEIEFEMLESIAFFVTESFRIERQLSEQAAREQAWHSVMEATAAASLIVDPQGGIRFMADKKKWLKFKEADPESYLGLACGNQKSAIRRCLNGSAEFLTLPRHSEASPMGSVQRLPDGGVLLLLQPPGEREEAPNKVQVDRLVWEELVGWAQERSATALSRVDRPSALSVPDEVERLRITDLTPASDLENHFSTFASEHGAKILLSAPEKAMRLSTEKHQALSYFLLGLSKVTTPSCWTVTLGTAKDTVRLQVKCENPPPSPQSIPSEPSSSPDLATGLLLLEAAGIKVTLERSSLGTRWTLLLKGLNETHYITRRHSPDYNVTHLDGLRLPEGGRSVTDNPSEESQSFSTSSSNLR